MGLTVGSTPVTAVYVGSTPVTAMYVGAEKIWPTIREVVQITMGATWEAQDQFRAALTARGLGYQTVEEIPFDIELVGTGATQHMFNDCAALTHAPDMDTSSVTNMSSMFINCSSLTHVPDMNTSSVTTMNGMFTRCTALTSAPDMNTSSVTNMVNMFRDCSSLTHVPDMNTSSVTDARYMFINCASLTDGNVRLIGRSPNVRTTNMISGSGLTREPFYDTDGNPI